MYSAHVFPEVTVLVEAVEEMFDSYTDFKFEDINDNLGDIIDKTKKNCALAAVTTEKVQDSHKFVLNRVARVELRLRNELEQLNVATKTAEKEDEMERRRSTEPPCSTTRAGVSFASEEQLPGVDLILPDIRFLIEERKNIVGLVITHGHEDHIGALMDLWPRLKVPLYATPFTAALFEAKRLSEPGAPQIPVKVVPLTEV